MRNKIEVFEILIFQCISRVLIDTDRVFIIEGKCSLEMLYLRAFGHTASIFLEKSVFDFEGLSALFIRIKPDQTLKIVEKRRKKRAPEESESVKSLKLIEEIKKLSEELRKSNLENQELRSLQEKLNCRISPPSEQIQIKTEMMETSTMTEKFSTADKGVQTETRN